MQHRHISLFSPPTSYVYHMILAVIPARYASSRFPGKPLIEIAGKSMIQRVYEQTKACELIQEVIVATDDDRIYQAVRQFGGKVEMTDPAHQSGTDRVAEVAARHTDYQDIINVQGDEPLLAPAQLAELIECLHASPAPIATLKRRLTDASDLTRPQVVKVVSGVHHQALYFSRSVIPFQASPEISLPYFRHVGLYAFRRDTLLAVAKLPQTALEQVEKLEQLRWLAHGYGISIAETQYESHAIDTPEDLQRLLQQNFPEQM